ncbi:RNA polymerase sigma factor [Primorskyibacter sp. S87]|uniref:RNA polymerase sigma factor n=1 Tax=Primorskyibacter sp. S87 TaxID=3415126 RepID=UPI003C7E666D
MSADHGFLVRQIANGDKRAFAALYRDLEQPTLRFIRSRMNDPFEANDILHDTFMEVWRSAGRFEGRSMVRTWIFGIAYRKGIDALRKRRRLDTDADMPEQPDPTVGADMVLNANEEAAHLRTCLDQLSVDHRMAVSLAFYEDMTYDEIAEVAGVPAGTIKSRVHHAKKSLLECLKTKVARQAG